MELSRKKMRLIMDALAEYKSALIEDKQRLELRSCLYSEDRIMSKVIAEDIEDMDIKIHETKMLSDDIMELLLRDSALREYREK